MLVWLENAYSRPFLRFFGGTFPPNDVTHRPNLQKDHPWAEPRRLIAMIGLRYLVQLPRYKRAIMSTSAHQQMRDTEREPFYNDIAHVIQNTKKSYTACGIRTPDRKAFGRIITVHDPSTTVLRIKSVRIRIL